MAKRYDLTAAAQYLRLLLYGRSGSTKTRTAYSACFDERTYPVLGLNLAGQPASIRFYDPQPDIVDIEKLEDINRFLNWLTAGQPTNRGALSAVVSDYELRPPYKCVVIDGFTELQRHVTANITGNSNKSPADRQNKTEIQHYGDILAQMTAIANAFYSLPLHVIGTALEYEREDSGSTTHRVLFQGQSRDQVPSYAEAVGRLMHIEKITPQLRRTLTEAQAITSETTSVAVFKPSTRYDAKDQYGAFGDILTDPTVKEMLDLIAARKEGKGN